MVEASKKYNVRVQVGHQNRSSANVIEAMKFLHSGGIGDVYMARGLCIKPRDSFGIAPDTAPPATLHYDNWLGPIAFRPYNEKKVIITGIGFGKQEMVIPATRDLTNLISHAGE